MPKKRNSQIQRRGVSAIGTGVGKGHKGNRRVPQITPIAPIPPAILLGFRGAGYIKMYAMGHCSILLTHSGLTGWVLSIAGANRYPDWDMVAKARYELLPHDKHFAMLLPPPEQYINAHNFCFILNEMRAGELPILESQNAGLLETLTAPRGA